MDTYLPEYCFSRTEGSELFFPSIIQLVKNSIYKQDIFQENTWQPANLKNRSIVLELMSKLVHTNSKIVNPENLQQLNSIIESNKSCIIMSEHYSNFDLPVLFYLVENFYKDLMPVLEKIVSLAAYKLNKEHKVVLAFSEGFNRIMIYPAREKLNIKENPTEEEQEELHQLENINRKAIKNMLKARSEGKIILMFPSGTRYRPEKPESRHALEQSASFLKRFDYVCFIGIAGNTLVVNPNNNMTEDILRKDVMVYYIDTPKLTSEFMAEAGNDTTNKQQIADYITNHLLTLHEKAEHIRTPFIQENIPEYLGPITLHETSKKFIKEYNIDPTLLI